MGMVSLQRAASASPAFTRFWPFAG